MVRDAVAAPAPGHGFIKLYKGVADGDEDYTTKTLNYAVHQTAWGAEWNRQETARVKQPFAQIIAWYAFGPFQWAGSPEYAEWWREWRESYASICEPDALGARRRPAITLPPATCRRGCSNGM